MGLPNLHAQRDDFNSGNDNSWVRYDPISTYMGGILGPQNTWSFPNGGYRLQSAISPASALGPGRVASLRSDATYDNFYVSADVVNWDNSVDEAFGLMGRVKELGLGTTDGYALTYQTGDKTVDITRFTDESTSGGTVVSVDFEMLVGKQYRMEFIGEGTHFIGRIYELPDTKHAVLEVAGFDGMHVRGNCGLISIDNSGTGQTSDVTFDNYLATESEPPNLEIVRDFFGDISVSWPTNSIGYNLQSSSAVIGQSWDTITGPFSEYGGRFYYFLGDPEEQKYYRLLHP